MYKDVTDQFELSERGHTVKKTPLAIFYNNDNPLKLLVIEPAGLWSFYCNPDQAPTRGVPLLLKRKPTYDPKPRVPGSYFFRASSDHAWVPRLVKKTHHREGVLIVVGLESYWSHIDEHPNGFWKPALVVSEVK